MEAFKERAGSVIVGAVIFLIFVAWAWPKEHWENEWYRGDCLAWNVTEYAGGMIAQADGPYVVADRWC